MQYPKAFLDEVRLRTVLSELIGRKVKVVRKGREYHACCPFHKEKTPSFTINDEKGFYHCFGCGAHGDAFSFLTQYENMPFPEAVELLARNAGLEIPQASPEDIKRAKKAAEIVDVLEDTAAFFEASLRRDEGKGAVKYLQSRGLSGDVAKFFRLGFSPDNGQALYAHLKTKGYSDDLMMRAGVVRESTRAGEPPYAFFRGRVMFPVCDMRGRPVAFGGRVLPSQFGGTAGADAPKYINSAENDVFHKGRMVYAHNFARKHISGAHPPIVVEGYMDVIALHKAGFKTAIAPLGTALTETQVMELWKFAPEDARVPILCFDGDSAGQRAAVRALERILPILKAGQSVRFAFMPDGMDPDELITARGAAAFQAVLDQAIPLSDMLWRHELGEGDVDTPEGRALLKNRLDKRVKEIADAEVQAFYRTDIMGRFSTEFGANEAALISATGKQRGYSKSAEELNKRLIIKKKTFVRPGEKSPHMPYRDPVRPDTDMRLRRPSPPAFLGERALLAAMINHPELFSEFCQELGVLEIGDAVLDRLRTVLIDTLTHHPRVDSARLGTMLREAGEEDALARVLQPSLYSYADFAKKDQPLDTVRAGWIETYRRARTKTRNR